MAGLLKRLAGPAYLGSSAANVYNPSANTYARVLHMHIVNTDSGARTCTLYIGATGGSTGGTEYYKTWALAAAGSAGSVLDVYPQLRLDAADFLTGLADVANKVVITVEGELYAA